ncbi:MAG: 16S rRNA (adenine(1518)-N(6)/adenine(1519)-N(6))-dimethyltransferase [Hyphomicrobiales bacterium]|mgnify:CR=1 FL=1|nr:MAG: 16S rRNA (adenine(1518)-N(6)/adenine(1519)-N(6))-dimethyltransferase [Hyphomicrobiales bacterium]
MAQIDDLPPLREVIRAHELSARKSLGQNFLLDLNLTSRIARSAGDLSDTIVVEVGPGPGGLTRAILAAGAKRLIAVERDRRCMAALAEIAAHYPGRLDVIEGDALEVDWPAALGGERAAIIANLPYNVATPLLIGWLQAEPWPAWWSSATLMFQREVAERIVAAPGDKAYGRLAVITGWRANARILFDVPPQAFTPPPKVVSSIVHVVPKPDPEPVPCALLEEVTGAAFGQRRKMLRSSLKALKADTETLIASAGLDPQQRAETVPISGFIALAQGLAEQRGKPA